MCFLSLCSREGKRANFMSLKGEKSLVEKQSKPDVSGHRREGEVTVMCFRRETAAGEKRTGNGEQIGETVPVKEDGGERTIRVVMKYSGPFIQFCF